MTVAEARTAVIPCRTSTVQDNILPYTFCIYVIIVSKIVKYLYVSYGKPYYFINFA